MRLATGTAILVSTTRLPSLAMLLLYHESRRTDGADVPLEKVVSKIAQKSEVRLYLPNHHERGKVSDTQVMLHIDSCVNDKTNEREQETQRNKGKPPSGPVTAKGEDQ